MMLLASLPIAEEFLAVIPVLVWSWRFSPTAGRFTTVLTPAAERIAGLPIPECSRRTGVLREPAETITSFDAEMIESVVPEVVLTPVASAPPVRFEEKIMLLARVEEYMCRFVRLVIGQ